MRWVRGGVGHLGALIKGNPRQLSGSCKTNLGGRDRTTLRVYNESRLQPFIPAFTNPSLSFRLVQFDEQFISGPYSSLTTSIVSDSRGSKAEASHPTTNRLSDISIYIFCHNAHMPLWT